MKQLLISTVFISLAFLSCKKEGCTDEDATNYNAEADVDDGSCEYQATINVWFDQSTSSTYQGLGVTEVTLFHAGIAEMSVDVTSYQASPPGCQQVGSMWFTLNMTSPQIWNVNLEVRDQNGTVLEYILWTADGGECENWKLL